MTIVNKKKLEAIASGIPFTLIESKIGWPKSIQNQIGYSQLFDREIFPIGPIAPSP